MEIKTFRFTGLQNFDRCANEIDRILNVCFQHPNDRFFMAVLEAVNNAAKYSVDSVTTAKITITMRIMQGDISVTIKSKTRPFDALAFQKKLQALLKDKKARDMDWGDYTKHQLGGRGYWYILEAVDYLYIDANGQSVTLCAKTPLDEDEELTAKVGALVPRFLVKKNGVIL